MNNKNKYTTAIFGSEYTIVASESEVYLEKLCNEVVSRMNSISESQDLKPMKAAVLTAINLCDELIKAKENVKILKDQMSSYSTEEEKLKREINVLEEEKKYLKNVIANKNNR